MSHAIFENKRAANYDQFVQNWIPNYQYFIEHLPRLLSEAAREELLVVGCGTGNEMLTILQQTADWKMTGVDPSPEMIRQAREKLKDYSGVSLVDGEITTLPGTPSFGAATLLLVLHFLEDNGDKLQLLQNISDRLKPGAPFVMLDITGTQQEIKDNLQVLKCLIPPEIDEEEIQERLKRIANELHHVSETRLVALLKAAGFETPLRFFQNSIYRGWLTRKS
ncbi:MAG: class I SAM-dependent methyltransferase [Bacteroidota bacterium]